MKPEELSEIAEFMPTDQIVQLQRSDLDSLKDLLQDALFPRVRYTGKMAEMTREAHDLRERNIKLVLDLLGRIK